MAKFRNMKSKIDMTLDSEIESITTKVDVPTSSSLRSRIAKIKEGGRKKSFNKAARAALEKLAKQFEAA